MSLPSSPQGVTGARRDGNAYALVIILAAVWRNSLPLCGDKSVAAPDLSATLVIVWRKIDNGGVADLCFLPQKRGVRLCQNIAATTFFIHTFYTQKTGRFGRAVRWEGCCSMVATMRTLSVD